MDPLSSSYLGMPFIVVNLPIKRVSSSKAAKKTYQLEGMLMSHGGSSVLINALLTSVSILMVSSFKIPKRVFQKVGLLHVHILLAM